MYASESSDSWPDALFSNLPKGEVSGVSERVLPAWGPSSSLDERVHVIVSLRVTARDIRLLDTVRMESFLDRPPFRRRLSSEVSS